VLKTLIWPILFFRLAGQPTDRSALICQVLGYKFYWKCRQTKRWCRKKNITLKTYIQAHFMFWFEIVICQAAFLFCVTFSFITLFLFKIKKEYIYIYIYLYIYIYIYIYIFHVYFISFIWLKLNLNFWF